MKKLFKFMNALILTICMMFSSWLPSSSHNLEVYADSNSSSLEVNQVYSGFKLVEKKYIEDIQSTAYEFFHEKSKAKLLFLENSDDKKIFAINFRTLPQDNTGVYHIIEHTISRQAKNIKLGGAFTTPEFTQYNVETKIGEDFEKDMDGLLDAVYNADIFDNKNIFMREGWRYELDSLEGELKINGIVYNEMSGNNSRFSILGDTINRSLFPDLFYSFNSGGDPKEIPNLTYEQFLDVYKQNYIPSNSFMFISGNLDIEKKLDLINKKYLGKMKGNNFINSIKIQKPLTKMKYVEDYYPARSGGNSKTLLSINYVFGEGGDTEIETALDILEYLLMTDASPFKKALLESNIGTPYSMSSFTKQPVWTLVIEADDDYNKGKLQKIVREELIKIVENGFDQDLLESTFNSFEMEKRGSVLSSSKGLSHIIKATLAWLYDESFSDALSGNTQISNLREKSKNGYFEQLIQKYILENNHSSLVVLKPKAGIGEEHTKALQRELADLKTSFSKEKLNDLIKENQDFLKWQEKTIQERKVAKNDLASLKKEVESIPTTVNEIDGVKVLNQPIFTNGIGYIHFYYDTKKVNKDQLMYLILLSKLLGKVDTANYNSGNIDSIIKKYTGGIDFSIYAYEDSKRHVEYCPKLQVSMSILRGNLEKGFTVLDEITNNSKYDNKKELQVLIRRIKSNSKLEIEYNPLSYAASQALSYASAKGKYNNLSFIPFYNFISDIDANFEAKADEIIRNLEEVSKIAFDKENLIVSYTGEKNDFLQFEKYLSNFISKLKVNNIPIQKYELESTERNQGYTLPINVQYIAKAGDFKQLGHEESGRLAVLNRVIEKYLFEKIRLKGGAYGEGAWIDESTIVFYSFDDPNLKETINTFNNASSFLKNLMPSQEEMDNYIYKAIEYIDYELEPRDKGRVWDRMYIMGKTQQDLQRYRNEIFATTAEDIRNYAALIDEIMKQNNLCVIGNGLKLKEQESIFQYISDDLNK